MEVWRWIDSGYDNGARQMATDVAILENMSLSKQPVMRVYRWKPACISLGVHQSPTCIDFGRCEEDVIDVVRRPTGGRAVLHDEEVTYAVILPGQSLHSAQSIGSVYNLISSGLAHGLHLLGIPAELQKRSVDLRRHYQTAFSVNCFSAAARHEIVLEKKKLVGSAQRRLAGGILQHGSILTGEAHASLPDYLRGLKPEEREHMKAEISEKTVSIGGYLNRIVDYSEVVEAVKKGMEKVLNLRFEEGRLSESEKIRIAELIKNHALYTNQEIGKRSERAVS